jgi:hypothetical protein
MDSQALLARMLRWSRIVLPPLRNHAGLDPGAAK